MRFLISPSGRRRYPSEYAGHAGGMARPEIRAHEPQYVSGKSGWKGAIFLFYADGTNPQYERISVSRRRA